MKKVLCFLVILISIKGGLLNKPILHIKHGKIKGLTQKTNTGKLYHAFKEIPYAKPPVGNLRFAEPISPDPWHDIKDTTKNTKICLHKIEDDLDEVGDLNIFEDCLYLNVFTPTSSKSELLPVYVYIHGGLFIMGNPTNYNFNYFLDEDIVIVTIGYRLSALGVLSTNDGVIPQNLGFKDQIFALKWVNENIVYFGGDPNKVTIGGHSSGSTSVGSHVLNTNLKGLFRAAILQSGSPLFIGYDQNVTDTAYDFVEQFYPEIRTKNTSELLEILRKCSGKLLAASDFVKLPSHLNSIFKEFSRNWLPSIEDSSFKNAAIFGPMHDNLENGTSNHVPVLMGITTQENLSYNVPKLFKTTTLATLFDYPLNIKLENKSKVLLDLKNVYTQTEHFADNDTALYEIHNDFIFNIPIINFAYLHSKYANVFFYEFAYKGVINGKGKYFGGPYYNEKAENKTQHCSELPFLYNYKIDPSLAFSEEDLVQRQILIKLWTNFIKYLTPTPEPEPLLQNILWPRVSRNDFKYVNLNSNITIQTNPKNFKTLQQKLEKYFEHPQYVF